MSDLVPDVSKTAHRQQAMTAFLDNFFAKQYTIESLAGDASFRRYHRIFCDGEHFLLMDAPPPERVDIFLHTAQVLGQVVNVPKIFAQDMAMGFLLLQDFGTVEFAHVITDNAQKDQCYHQALQTLCDLQTLDINADDVKQHLPLYDEHKLNDEMDLFCEWLSPYLELELDDKLWQALKKTVIAQVLTQKQVAVHRDYHSRNLMQDKNSQRLGVIDFQDAVIGAYSYDLVSLVRDAYIDSDEAWVNEQIAHFYQLAGIAQFKSLQDFICDVNVMGVQRHLKVLGIFVRLYQRDGKDRYLANMPKVMADLITELQWLSANTHETIYGQFLAYIEAMLPKFQAKFA